MNYAHILNVYCLTHTVKTTTTEKVQEYAAWEFRDRRERRDGRGRKERRGRDAC